MVYVLLISMSQRINILKGIMTISWLKSVKHDFNNYGDHDVTGADYGDAGAPELSPLEMVMMMSCNGAISSGITAEYSCANGVIFF